MKAKSIRSAAAVSVFAMLVCFGRSAHAREPACSMERGAGTYGFTESGTIPARGGFVFLSVGRGVIDAQGNISGEKTTSLNGAIIHETFTGTATVNADCTGTAVVNVFQGGTLVRSTPLDFVAVDDQNEIHAILLAEGTALSAIIKRISRAGQ